MNRKDIIVFLLNNVFSLGMTIGAFGCLLAITITIFKEILK